MDDREMPQSGTAGSPSPGRKPLWTIAKAIIQLAIAVAVVFGGITLAQHYLDNPPEARRRGGGGGGEPGQPEGGPPRNATLVEVVEVEAADHEVVIEASGRAVPAREISLYPQVQGQIVEIHDDLEPGGFLSEGDVVARIDDTDYELAERQADANRDAARANQRLGRAAQEIARAEYEIFGHELDESNRDLVLRQPQLDSANANYESADAALERARLNVRRTRVTAPFDAVVQSRTVNLGSRVGENTELARLVGTDRFWIEVAVPADQLQWIRIPQQRDALGSTVRVFHSESWGPDTFRQGRVVRLEPRLEDGGRLARLLVAVEDPLALAPENVGRPVLFLGAFVSVEIDGRSLESAIALSPEYVRDGRFAWVVDDESRLDIRPIEIAFRRRDSVLVTGGLQSGDQVVSSALPAPVQGMTLRTSGADGRQPNDGSPGQAGGADGTRGGRAPAPDQDGRPSQPPADQPRESPP